MKPKKILFCVLNWGLGHATRSIPLIESLLANGHVVHIASDGNALDLLTHSFPSCISHTLPPYNIYYSKHRYLGFTLLFQSQKVRRAIQDEHNRVAALHEEHQYDEVISDNRMGCRITCCHSIYMTHQLHIMGGVAGWVLSGIHRYFIKKFNELWIPDDPTLRLSGNLTIWKNNPLPTTWVGRLSRIPPPIESDFKRYDAAIVLSGPEPQRSILENILIKKLTPIYSQLVLVRGCDNGALDVPPNLEVIPMANGKLLSEILSASKHLYCRSGYSTLMDIYPFDLNVTLIPTPGQSEQEYLAAYHKKKSGYELMNQHLLQNRNHAIKKLV